jgi:hypothetical protein
MITMSDFFKAKCSKYQANRKYPVCVFLCLQPVFTIKRGSSKNAMMQPIAGDPMSTGSVLDV